MVIRMPIPKAMRKRLSWCTVMGILTIVLGSFLIAYPLATATITTLLLGWALILVGIAQFIFALHSEFAGRFLAKAFLSILYCITGLALALFPFGGVAALTAMLGTLLIVHAGLMTITAFRARVPHFRFAPTYRRIVVSQQTTFRARRRLSLS